MLYYCYPNGKTKALTMSYDDGRIHDVRLVSIFNKYGIKGTFNLNYGIMKTREGRVPLDQVAELYRGHEVATHTAFHPSLARCPLTVAAREILEDRAGLESLVGYPVRGHAYPNGSYTKEVEDLFRGLGIAYGRIVGNSESFDLPANPMEWQATCHHNYPKLMELAQSLVDFRRTSYLKLMYVWGHSYEFDDRDNWNVIEEFCAYMGGREEFWYATNIEIIDYLETLKRLQFTADSTAVYNPSVISAWLQVDGGRIVEAKGGCYTSLV